jgi:glycosyltransferase involved in cell wall biosynthesis
LIEYAAAGISTVATDVGGNREIVENGVSGFLVPPQAETLLAERIIELLQNPEKRRTMGEKGRILVQTKFAQDRILEQYYDFYRNLGGVPAIRNGA